MISVSIDVSKIDKSLFIEGKTGKKWLNVILWETPNDQYNNDYRVNQGVSKEARLAGVKGKIIGNAKIIGNRPSTPQTDEAF